MGLQTQRLPFSSNERPDLGPFPRQLVMSQQDLESEKSANVITVHTKVQSWNDDEKRHDITASDSVTATGTCLATKQAMVDY